MEASLFTDWYLPDCGISVSDAAKADWFSLWQSLGDSLLEDKKIAVLRDYHSVNLMWREAHQARYRIGLIDVQDALQGHPAYDLASLVYDARLDVDPEFQAEIKAQYCAQRFENQPQAQARFERGFAICAVQRNLKIAGIFVRLAKRDGKPAYLAHLPRVLSYIEAHIEAPDLAPVKAWFDKYAATIWERAGD